MTATIEQTMINDTRYFYPSQPQNYFLEGVSVTADQVTGMLVHQDRWNEVVGEFAFIPQGVTGDEEKEYIRMGQRFENAPAVMLGGQEYRQVPLDIPTALKDLDQWITIEKTLRARGKDQDRIDEVAHQAPIDTELAMTIGSNSLLASSVKTYYKQSQPTLPAQYQGGGPAM